MLDAVSTGLAMRRKRTEAGVHNSADIARAMGVTRAYVSALELGKTVWTPERVSRYEAALREAVVVREHRAAAKAANNQQQKGG